MNKNAQMELAAYTNKHRLFYYDRIEFDEHTSLPMSDGSAIPIRDKFKKDPFNTQLKERFPLDFDGNGLIRDTHTTDPAPLVRAQGLPFAVVARRLPPYIFLAVIWLLIQLKRLTTALQLHRQFCHDFTVCRGAVRWLEFLKSHHPGYRHLTIEPIESEDRPAPHYQEHPIQDDMGPEHVAVPNLEIKLDEEAVLRNIIFAARPSPEQSSIEPSYSEALVMKDNAGDRWIF
ncbi:hypothetical protein N7530_002712 [Penicillium desertorum]|uniref:Uncharacterized protein n=1 Tax=Penicillium desertorum TaxID=1303715 RepID=A0A9W9X443_9EURO|nr:hypothetical protein N7530_002712 [Penicillium desertorum]